MISSVTIDAGGKAEVLRLPTKAMARLESEYDGMTFFQFWEGVAASPRITDMVAILAAMMNNGDGADRDAAADLIDQIGFEAAVDIIGDVANKAFPETAGKNTKGARRPAPKK